MTPSGLSQTRILVIRLTCVSFSLSSFLLGGWIMIDPSSFGELLGVSGDPFVQALYGGAIWGEGTMFALGAIWPVRYLVFFQYLVIYKTMACFAGSAVLLNMDSPSFGAWLLLGGWASAGLISAAVFPWPQWRTVESWYGVGAAGGRSVR